MIPEDGTRPYPRWIPWLFAAACLFLVAAVLSA